MRAVTFRDARFQLCVSSASYVGFAAVTPEERARQQIDRQLEQCGWTIQNFKSLNLSAARGVAVREVPLKSGRCDYLLLVDRLPVGVI